MRDDEQAGQERARLQVELGEPGVKTHSATDDDVPARRLLAHDLEPIVWDEVGEGPVPPPD
jgi:hypothetical protein